MTIEYFVNKIKDNDTKEFILNMYYQEYYKELFYFLIYEEDLDEMDKITLVFQLFKIIME